MLLRLYPHDWIQLVYLRRCSSICVCFHTICWLSLFSSVLAARFYVVTFKQLYHHFASSFLDWWSLSDALSACYISCSRLVDVILTGFSFCVSSNKLNTWWSQCGAWTRIGSSWPMQHLHPGREITTAPDAFHLCCKLFLMIFCANVF